MAPVVRSGVPYLGCPFLNEPGICYFSLLVVELEEPYRLWGC